jgi:hypothetical protein
MSVVIGQNKIYRFKDLEIWHERGFIRVLKPSTGELESCSLHKFGDRMVGLLDAYKLWQRDRRGHAYLFEGYSVKHWTDFFENASKVMQECKEYGDLTNVRTLRERGEDNLRKTSRLFIPGFVAP